MTSSVVLKVILVGQSGVGKTALQRRYIKRFFPENERTTIGVDLGVKTVEIDGIRVELRIWDSAGTERFRSLTTSYYRNADVAVLVYALDDPDSLFELQSWSREVCSHGDMMRVLVGNKSDLENRKVSEDMAVNFALLENMDFVVDCSAKRDDNVEYLFRTIAKKMLVKRIEANTKYPREKYLKYPSAENALDNLTLSKNNKSRHSTLGAKPKRIDIFKRFCVIL